MSCHEIVCANKIVRYHAFLGQSNSYLCAVYHQLKLLDIKTPFHTFQEFQTALKAFLIVSEFYPNLPTRHEAQFSRILVRYLKVALEVSYPTGFVQAFPFIYRINEPTIRLLSLQNGYGSVTKVSL